MTTIDHVLEVPRGVVNSKIGNSVYTDWLMWSTTRIAVSNLIRILLTKALSVVAISFERNVVVFLAHTLLLEREIVCV